MIGAIMVFVGTVGLVGTYMTVVHSFLRSAEEPQDTAREQAQTERKPERPRRRLPRPQLAH